MTRLNHLSIVALSILVCISILHTQNASGADNNGFSLKEKATLICKFPETDEIFTTTLKTNLPSADSIAVAVKDKNGKKCVSLNGKKGEIFDDISVGVGLVFSPDGKHLAYIAKKDKQAFVVYDGKKSEPYEAVANIAFSADGSRFVYIARNSTKHYFAVDNWKKGQVYEGIWGDRIYPIISPDSKQVVYLASKNAKDLKNIKWFLVVNDKESEPYDDIKGVIYSPDSKHFAYAGKTGDKWTVIIDGKPGIPLDDVYTFSFSPNSAHTLYTGKKSSKHVVISDGKIVGEYKEITQPFYSPDSSRYIFSERKNDDKSWIFINNEKGPAFKNIGLYLFSPDSKSFSYLASDDGVTSMVVVNNKNGKKYETVSPQHYSPDSSRLTYKAKRKDKQFLVIDNRELPEYDEIAAYMFSPDSKRYAYAVKNKDECFLVIDGKEQKHFDKLGMMAFSPDSRHIVYQASKDGQWFIVVDSLPAKETYKGFLNNVPLIFSSPSTFCTLAIRSTNGPEFYRTEITIIDK